MQVTRPASPPGPQPIRATIRLGLMSRCAELGLASANRLSGSRSHQDRPDYNLLNEAAAHARTRVRGALVMETDSLKTRWPAEQRTPDVSNSQRGS